MRHQPGERAGAEVFERKRRPVKQLDDAQAVVKSEDRHRKIERITDDRFQRRAIEFVTRELCRQCNRDVLKRSSALAVPPVVSQAWKALRNVQSAVGREPGDHRLLERDRRRLPPSADANHTDDGLTGVTKQSLRLGVRPGRPTSRIRRRWRHRTRVSWRRRRRARFPPIGSGQRWKGRSPTNWRRARRRRPRLISPPQNPGRARRASVRRSNPRANAITIRDRWSTTLPRGRRRWPTDEWHRAAAPDRRATFAQRRFPLRCGDATPRTPARRALAVSRCRAAAHCAQGRNRQRATVKRYPD